MQWPDDLGSAIDDTGLPIFAPAAALRTASATGAGAPLTRENLGCDGPRSGHWTVKSTLNGSGIDHRCPTVHRFAPGNNTADAATVGPRNVAPIAGSTLQALRRATQAQQRERVPEIEEAAAVEQAQRVEIATRGEATAAVVQPRHEKKGFYAPAVRDIRGLRIRGNSGQSEIVRAPFIAPEPKEKTPPPQPQQKVADAPATPARDSSVAFTRSVKRAQNRVRIMGKHGEEAFMELPTLVPASRQTSRAPSVSKPEATNYSAIVNEKALQASRNVKAAQIAAQLRNERERDSPRKSLERKTGSPMAAGALMSGALPASAKGSPTSAPKQPYVYSIKSSSKDSAVALGNVVSKATSNASPRSAGKQESRGTSLHSVNGFDAMFEQRSEQQSQASVKSARSFVRSASEASAGKSSSASSSKDSRKSFDGLGGVFGLGEDQRSEGSEGSKSASTQATSQTSERALSNSAPSSKVSSSKAPSSKVPSENAPSSKPSLNKENTSRTSSKVASPSKVSLEKALSSTPQLRQQDEPPSRPGWEEVGADETSYPAGLFYENAPSVDQDSPWPVTSKPALPKAQSPEGPSQPALLRLPASNSNSPYDSPPNQPTTHHPNHPTQHHRNPSHQTIFAGRGWISPHPLSRTSSSVASPPQSRIQYLQNERGEPATMTFDEWEALRLREESLQQTSLPESAARQVAHQRSFEQQQQQPSHLSPAAEHAPRRPRRNVSATESSALEPVAGAWGQADVASKAEASSKASSKVTSEASRSREEVAATTESYRAPTVESAGASEADQESWRSRGRVARSQGSGSVRRTSHENETHNSESRHSDIHRSATHSASARAARSRTGRSASGSRHSRQSRASPAKTTLADLAQADGPGSWQGQTVEAAGEAYRKRLEGIIEEGGGVYRW